ncbi:MAG: di-trans,poly-cis-decaprenylcistransferase [Theionarchaea archaeon]|nr:di-trans,poly-cis-decaprenylcistransferase [Theionarchaea archaeon]MBU7036574.1 di-trans,poly-cis-decaprenylcistransferase [Theionarchaea archaeon]
MHLKSFLYSHIPSFLMRPVYYIYEAHLIDEIHKGTIPKHIGIIMDGNRRFAREIGVLTLKGHQQGAYKIEEILDWCSELRIKEITVYAFSTENFNRSKKEVNHLMDLFEKKFYEIAEDERIHRNRIRIRALGNLSLLPEKVRKAIQTAEEATQNYDNQFFNVCIAYGGRLEIIEAFKKVAKKITEGGFRVNDITEKVIKEHLYRAGPDPDLIIRTGGEVRLSNFLLFQAAYSELFFCDIYFPAFRKVDFLRIIREFQKRRRRYGE